MSTTSIRPKLETEDHENNTQDLLPSSYRKYRLNIGIVGGSTLSKPKRATDVSIYTQPFAQSLDIRIALYDALATMPEVVPVRSPFYDWFPDH